MRQFLQGQRFFQQQFGRICSEVLALFQHACLALPRLLPPAEGFSLLLQIMVYRRLKLACFLELKL